MSRLWGWLVSAALVALVTIQRLVGQRQAARRTAQKARARADKVEHQQQVEKDAQEAVNSAAQQAKDTKEGHNARSEDDRPSGDFRRD